MPVAPGVHWIGAFDPDLRSFDIILRTANGTSYNAYAVRGSAGVAIIDTVKANFADRFFRRLESVADYREITTIVLNQMCIRDRSWGSSSVRDIVRTRCGLRRGRSPAALETW